MTLKQGKNTAIGVKLECRRFVFKYCKLPKARRHTKVDSLAASYECCKFEGSYPRPLAGKLSHRLSLVDLNPSQQRSTQRELELWRDVHSAKRAFGDFWAAYIGESGQYYSPREVICQIKTLVLYCVTCQLSQNKSLCWYLYLFLFLCR